MALFELLSVETGASFETLRRIIMSAPRRYKVYQIPKRNGGFRTIAHPARELKLLQRVILRAVFDKISVSDVATAYISNRGIVFNARCHASQPWLLKLDFKDFFHSIKPADWDRIVRRTPDLKLLSQDRAAMHRLLFWEYDHKSNIPTCLSIGAPTSPSISNMACLKLDEWMIDQARRLNLTVTRYADDITVSGSELKLLLRFEALLNNVLGKNRGVNLALNNKKRGVYGPGERRLVTGLVITPEGKVSIGRDRKREISSLVHRYTLGGQEHAVTMHVRGLVAFAMSVEPDFVESLRKKYGRDVVTRLMSNEPLIEANNDYLEF